MKKCNLCPSASNFYYEYRGKNYDENKLLIILNHADSRVVQKYFYKEILLMTSTGKTLNSILKSCGFGFKDVLITNFVKCNFPKDREPNKKEYEQCKGILEKQIETLSPKVILLWGQKPYEYLFSKESTISEMTGKEIDYNGIPCMVNFHPSKINKMFAVEKLREHYEPIQKFLLKYKICDKVRELPKQVKLEF